MDYLFKYNKYKNKYLELKSQLGGSDLNDQIQSLKLDNLHTIPYLVSNYLSTIIPQDKFLNHDDIRNLIDKIGLDKIMEYVIIYYMYKKNDKYYNVMNIYDNPTYFFSKLYQLVLATQNIWIHLNKYIKNNEHTILLIPGDSPSYFLFLIKLLYPEILVNPKVTIVEFPISGLGSISDNIINFSYDDGVPSKFKINVDGKPYLKFIIENNVPETIRQKPHQFVIIDYLEAGKSAVFIEHTIKELYDKELYRVNKNFVQVINLAYYFQTTVELKKYLSELTDLEKKKQIKLKSKPDYFTGLKGAKKWEKFLFANWYLYLYPKFLKGLNDFATYDSINVLKYLVDETDRRCQYKIRLNEATCISYKSSSMADFLSQIPKSDTIHLHCNIFNILLYLISGHLEQMNLKTGELFDKIIKKILSLIPKDVPIKLNIDDSELSLVINSDNLINNKIKVGPKNTIGILDVKSIVIN